MSVVKVETTQQLFVSCSLIPPSPIFPLFSLFSFLNHPSLLPPSPPCISLSPCACVRACACACVRASVCVSDFRTRRHSRTCVRSQYQGLVAGTKSTLRARCLRRQRRHQYSARQHTNRREQADAQQCSRADSRRGKNTNNALIYWPSLTKTGSGTGTRVPFERTNACFDSTNSK